MSDSLARALRDAVDHADDRDPHRQSDVLRCALRKHALSPAEAASAIGDAFGYEPTPAAVRSAKHDHGIPDPMKYFDDLRGGDDDSEPAQPRSTFLLRSTDTAAHPFDTASVDHDCFETVASGVGAARGNAETPTTPHFPSTADTDSPTSAARTTDSPSGSGTHPLKPPSDPPPSEYRVLPPERDQSLIAPPWAAQSDALAPKYHACGCGDCDGRTFLDGDGGPVDCPTAVPVTVAGARRVYEKTAGSNAAAERTGNEVDRGRQQYARLMKADSAALRARGPDPDPDGPDEFAGSANTERISTVLASLRVSPTDGDDRLVTPFTLVRDVQSAWTEARDEIPRDAAGGLLSYFWTLAGTEGWATPHVHLYAWYVDRDDVLDRSAFVPMVARFVDASTFAPVGAHFDGAESAESTRSDGRPVTDGAVRVEHDPLLADPERLETRLGDGYFADLTDDRTGPRRLTDGRDEQSRGAIYVGTQLPKLALLGAEAPADVEMAAFVDAVNDGRHVAHGGGSFYFLANAIDCLSEYESAPTE